MIYQTRLRQRLQAQVWGRVQDKCCREYDTEGRVCLIRLRRLRRPRQVYWLHTHFLHPATVLRVVSRICVLCVTCVIIFPFYLGKIFLSCHSALMPIHLALLRGVNVGGNKKLPMADLCAFVEELGFNDARTLLQSGNLVFRSDGGRTDAALESFLEAEAAKRLGLSTVFLLRTAQEWAEIIACNPFPEEAAKDPSHLVVMFLRVPPPTDALEKLRAVAVGAERIHPDGRHLYAIFPHGIGDSKLSAALMGPRFSPHATGRNWNTVRKMAAMIER